jgi:glucose dehydrogenase
MYVTAGNEVHALDTSTGQWIWVWQAYKDRSKGINRGVAIYEDKLFFSTSDCRLVALNKETGNLVWSVKYTDSQKKHFSTMAPLVIKDKIILGVANNNTGEGGFIAAFSTTDGKELWRFQTLSAESQLKGAPTWLTGSYDPVTDTIYWPVGTLPDHQRSNPKSYEASNSYSDSVVALNAQNGRIVWSTRLSEQLPIDWDSNEPLVLAEINHKKIILQANRNGIFYSLDRIKGGIIFSKPFVKKIDWASK